MDLETRRLQSVEISHLGAKPTVLRFHPTRTDIVTIGFENGQIFFLKLKSSETFVFNSHKDCGNI